MIPDRLDVIRRAAEALRCEGHEAEVRERYSGRAMFGATVPAIVTDAPAVLLGVAFAVAIADAGEELQLPVDTDWVLETAPKVAPLRADDMGLSRVYY